jgi:hypothetical protein
MIYSLLLGVLNTQCIAGVTFDRMIMYYMHDEYSNMLFTLGTCNSQTGTAARKYMLCYYNRPNNLSSDLGSISWGLGG